MKNNQHTIPELSQKLDKRVLNYSSGQFDLRKDIQALDKVYAARVPDAVVFYCARILEVIMKDAHKRFFGESNHLLASNVARLEKYNLLPASTFYWAKGLRLLGNDVRHINRTVDMEEAELAIFFLEFCLKWFFCHYPLGEKYSTYKCTNGDLSPSSKSHLVNIAWTLEKKKLDTASLKRAVASNEGLFRKSFFRNPTLPTLLIEMFITAGEYAEAKTIIDTIATIGKKFSAHYPRFVELKGLYYSRTKNYERALDELLTDGYYERYKYDISRVDDDRIGILGGIYKNIWAETGCIDSLKKSHETYTFGWKNRQIKRENGYLGINAATTALMLGHVSDCQRFARDTVTCLTARQKLILEKTDQARGLDYWDLVTLGEAHLLLSETDQAKELYSSAFAQHADLTENINVTRKQMATILDKTNLNLSVEQFLQVA